MIIDTWIEELRAARRGNSTLAAYRSDMAHVCAGLSAVHGIEVEQLTTEHLTRKALIVVFDRLGEKLAPASVRRAMATCGQVCRHLVHVTEELASNPMEMIKRPRLPERTPRVITAEDYPARLLAAATTGDEAQSTRWPARDVALVATYLSLGVRCSEALGIRPGDIGTNAVRIQGKRNKQRLLPTTPGLRHLWAVYQEERAERFPELGDADGLFVHARSGKTLIRQQVQNLLHLLYVQAGMRDEVPAGALVHCLRHGFATEAVRAGSDLVELRDFLGHESIAVTNIYLHSDAERLRALAHNHPAGRAISEAIAGP